MQLHLNHTPKPSVFKIDHQHKLLLIGSCFAENIGEYLSTHRFNTLLNPSGILFNPISIYQSLINCIENKTIDESLILKRNDIFFSYLHHSSIFHPNKNELSLQINSIQSKAHSFLKEADFLIITFGSAFVYWHKQLNATIANCHKQSSSEFDKKLLSVSEIVEKYNDLIHVLKKFNPKLQIIFTISPVKYLKDGIEENNVSKATLLLAINELKKNSSVYYFPAFELVNDDLRDYRFYKTDMAHPNEQAIEYVWDKFSDTYFSNETKQLNKEIFSIVNSEKHILLFPESEVAKLFTTSLEKKKKDLNNRFPFLAI